MQSGEASVGFLFTPFASLIMQEFPQYKLVYPKEGLGFGIDGFVLTGRVSECGKRPCVPELPDGREGGRP